MNSKLTMKSDVEAKAAVRLQERYEKLVAMNAPKMNVDFAANALANVEKAAGVGVEFDVEFVEKNVRTGRGGKTFVEYKLVDGRTAYYFPQGRFGPFAKFAE